MEKIRDQTLQSKKEFFGFKDASLDDGIIRCTAVLNQLGYFPEKSLKKADKVESQFSDRLHIAQAYKFDGIISIDFRLCEKARAIYIWKKPSCIVYYPITQNSKINCIERNGLKHFTKKACLKSLWTY